MGLNVFYYLIDTMKLFHSENKCPYIDKSIPQNSFYGYGYVFMMM